MDTNDGDENTMPDESLQSLPVASQRTMKGLPQQTILRIDHAGHWAELVVEWWFDAIGGRFYVEARRYRVERVGGNKGNVELGFHSKSGWGWYEISNDDAIQDANWHPISGGGNVPGNGSNGFLSFRYTWDLSGVSDPKGSITVEVHFSLSPPVISPIGVVPSRNFRLSGLGVPEAVVSVFSLSGGFLGSQTVQSTGVWAVNVTMPETVTEISMYATQIFNNHVSPRSDSVTASLPSATITRPAAGQTVRIENLVFEGVCTKGVTLGVVRTEDHWTGLTPEGVVANGSWTRSLLPNILLPTGIINVQAYWKLDATGFSPSVSFRVNSYPEIAAPAAGSEQNPTVTVTGTGARIGATIEIQEDLNSANKYGSAVATADAWSVVATIPPGVRSVVAEQTLNNVRSGPGIPRIYRIRPPVIIDTKAVVDAEGNITFSGSGFGNALVELHITNNHTPFASVTVTGTTWSIVISGWLPGTYSINVRQSITDSAGLKIYSLWSPNVLVALLVPEPILTAEVGTDNKPVFSGTGRYWPNEPAAQVEVRLSNTSSAIVPLADVRSDRTWSSAAQQAWAPKTYSVVARQGFKGQWSVWTQAISVVILHQQPTLLITQNGLTPAFNGTCLANATVAVTFSGDSQTYAGVVNGTTWSFTRPTPFPEGVTHTVTVIQKVGEHLSHPASLTFTVEQVIPKPTISEPAEGAEVSRRFTVRGGDGMAGATMQLRDAQFQRPLGEPKLLSANGHWEITLEELALRDYTLDTQQTLNGRQSERSEMRNFTVTVLAPGFVNPQPGGDLPRTSTLSGTGEPGATVTVWLEGDDAALLQTLVNAEGAWSGEVSLPVGPVSFTARQSASGQTSKPVQVSARIVPARPTIESPIGQQPIGARVVVSGFGFVGDTITLKRGAQALGQVQVQPDRTWSTVVILEAPDGPVTLTALATSDGFESSATELPLMLGLFRPTIDQPAEGQRVEARVGFAGQGLTGVGKVLAWYNPQLIHAKAIAVTPAGWLTTAEPPLNPGPAWVVFEQTLIAGPARQSERVQSKRFEVLDAEARRPGRGQLRQGDERS